MDQRMDHHKKQLESLEAALGSAANDTIKQQALLEILEKYPLLYGYWLKYLQEFHPNSRGKWLEALRVCPVIELYQQYFSVFPDNLDDYEVAVEQVGHYFLSAPIWDLYLQHKDASPPKILARAITMPLYDYAKYFAQAKDVLTDIDLTAAGQQMAEEIGQRWKYESKIQRPYFHVLPLEQTDLDNWNNYLDYQELSSDKAAGVALYRRCLVATALYPAFWKRYLRFVGRFAPQLLDSVYQGALQYLESTPEFTSFAILYASYLEVWDRKSDAEKVLTTLNDKSALDDFNYRHRGAPSELSLAEARALWATKSIDKYKYLEILKQHGELEEYFEVDIIVNGPPDASRTMRKLQAPAANCPAE